MAVANLLAELVFRRDDAEAVISQPGYNRVTDPGTLSPLPHVLQRGLPAVVVLAFLSFFLSIALLIRLVYRMVVYRESKLYRNQFIILIVNLLVADIQQSTSFWINYIWLRDNALTVSEPACFAQGFFISNGDLASGIFTMAIGFHTFVDIVFSYQPSQRLFLVLIACCHAFVYFCSIFGMLLHGVKDYYMRAGTWCWVNPAYGLDRLYLHYLWILIAEFGTVVLYTVLFVILRHRISSGYYASSKDGNARAKAAMRALLPYPIIYVVCTLPLAATRVATMAGRPPTFAQMVVAGAMITSNGWLDVLLYSLTRRALIFGRELPGLDMRALDTFYNAPGGSSLFGTTTTIHGGKEGDCSSGWKSRASSIFTVRRSHRSDSEEELVCYDAARLTALGLAHPSANSSASRLKVKTEVRISSVPLAVAEWEASQQPHHDASHHSRSSSLRYSTYSQPPPRSPALRNGNVSPRLLDTGRASSGTEYRASGLSPKGDTKSAHSGKSYLDYPL